MNKLANESVHSDKFLISSMIDKLFNKKKSYIFLNKEK